jgi:hypothetical protein
LLRIEEYCLSYACCLRKQGTGIIADAFVLICLQWGTGTVPYIMHSTVNRMQSFYARDPSGIRPIKKPDTGYPAGYYRYLNIQMSCKILYEINRHQR